MKFWVKVVLVGILLLLSGFILLNKSPYSPKQVSCTLEAKLCSDGSSVGRIPPNCEFAPCPTDAPTKTGSGIKGVVLLGPTCPVIQDPPEGECEDKLYETTLVVTTPDGARVIVEFSSDENGEYNVSVPPGEYSIRSASASKILPYCNSSETVVVKRGSYTEATIYCDTGIR